LIRYKGFDLLAQALQPISRDSRWTLTIVGSGPLEAEVRRAFSDWAQVTLVLGWQPRDQIERLLTEHDLLLCPYVEASQSGVVAEALAVGLPSAVMPVGALPEQVGRGRGGLVANDTTAAALARLLQAVLDNPALLMEVSAGALSLFQERRNARVAPALFYG
jgi:glycosyltransferase involved in cell wall biosynthesis